MGSRRGTCPSALGDGALGEGGEGGEGLRKCTLGDGDGDRCTPGDCDAESDRGLWRDVEVVTDDDREQRRFAAGGAVHGVAYCTVDGPFCSSAFAALLAFRLACCVGDLFHYFLVLLCKRGTKAKTMATVFYQRRTYSTI